MPDRAEQGNTLTVTAAADGRATADDGAVRGWQGNGALDRSTDLPAGHLHAG
jgi:hypothetical protein